MTQHDKEYLTECLFNNICYIALSSTNKNIDFEDDDATDGVISRPYTSFTANTGVFNVGTIVKTDQPDMIATWDITASKSVLIDIKDVLGWSMRTMPTGTIKGAKPLSKAAEQEHDMRASLAKLKLDLHEIKCCSEHVPQERVESARFRQDCDETNWQLLKAIGFVVDNIRDATQLDESKMCEAREQYMNFIREHRKKSFEELDQLEKEAKDAGAGDEDIQDIDTIKQMFRDIPQDTDLSKYKTVEELINFWPSLILPNPLNHILLDKIKQIREANASRDVFDDIIETFTADNINDITELLKDMKAKKPTVGSIKKKMIEEAESINMLDEISMIDERAQAEFDRYNTLYNKLQDKLNILLG